MKSPRGWIWLAVSIQVVGVGFEAAWHGLLDPGFEATTVREMAAHLGTVHLPIYIGALAVLASTAWALVDRMKRATAGVALPVAFTGAVVATAAEVWHAATHLQLSTRGGPIAGSIAWLGLLVVIVAVWLSGLGDRRRAAATRVDRRRAA